MNYQLEQFTQDSITEQLKEIVVDANQLDRDWQALKLALQDLGDRRLLALKVPVKLGGRDLDALEYGSWQMAIAQISGTLAFLQTQHQSAGSFLSKSPNHNLQQAYLPLMATGQKLVGVGFSQLRRPGKPLVMAQTVEDGFELSGTVPWVTGGKIFSEFIIGANLPDGRELYGVVPLENHSSKLKVSQPMDLIAMSATNTVSVELKNWHLDSDLVVNIKPPGQIHLTSQKNTLNHCWFPLGCAAAAVDILQTTYQKRPLDAILESQVSLENERKQCHLAIQETLSKSDRNYQKDLELRARAIDLAFRCAQAAVIANSGAANSYLNSAGRVYREALVFSVSGQTSDIMSASLNQLSTGNGLEGNINK